MQEDDETRQLDAVRSELVREFGDRLPPGHVEARLEATLERFRGAPVRTFVPLLAHRQVRRELTEAR